MISDVHSQPKTPWDLKFSSKNTLEFRLTVDTNPVMGIHEILGNALQSLPDENTLSSWTIHHDNSGHISVKITGRFKQADNKGINNEGSHCKRKSRAREDIASCTPVHTTMVYR